MKVVGAVSVFNEEDIIEEWITYHLSQGLEIIVLDGGSTDSTFDICKKFSEKKQIKLFQIKENSWNLAQDLINKYDLALRECPDWFIHMDVDEFFESGINGLTLRDSIKKVDNDGFNLIQFDRFEFFITDKDDNSNSVMNRQKYYSFETDFIFRAWKFYPGIMIEPAGGHYPVFPINYQYKIYPRKMICRHYRFRNLNQASDKIKNRLGRPKSTDLKLGWHSHIKKIVDEKKPFLLNTDFLTKYNEDDKWNKEKTFSYFNRTHPKKSDIFSETGMLKHPFPSYNELRLQVRDLRKNSLQTINFKRKRKC